MGMRRIDGLGTSLVVFDESQSEMSVLAEFAEGETIHQPRWSPDEKRILFRKGEGPGAELMVMKVKSALEDPEPQSLLTIGEEADAVWCGPSRVAAVADDNEIAVFELI